MKKLFRRVISGLSPQKLQARFHLFLRVHDYLLLPKKNVVYGEDGLYTYNAAPFLKDKDFLEAYALGEETQSWHGGTIRWRAYIACWTARQAAGLPGDFIECGVNRGGLARAIVAYTRFDQLGKRFFLVDNFTGLVPEYLNETEKKKQLLDLYAYYKDNSKDYVTRTFAAFPSVKVVQGSVPAVLPLISAGSVAFLSLDMNCTMPEIKAAEFFWERMVPGGMILLDDYGQEIHSEQQLAFDDFARRRGVQVLCLPTGQGLIVKTPPPVQPGS